MQGHRDTWREEEPTEQVALETRVKDGSDVNRWRSGEGARGGGHRKYEGLGV